MELKLLGAAIGALMTCAPAHAATFLFTLNGPPYAEFELDSAVPPSSFDDTRSNFTGVVGTFDRMIGSA